MHYKNGREAHEGDQIIHRDPYTKKVTAGVLHTTSATAQTCNGQLARALPGRVADLCVTIGDCVHAEDAYEALAGDVAPQV